MKYFTTFLLILFCSSQAYAQLGVRAGINLAKLNFQEDFDYVDLKPIVGLNLGALYEIQLSDKFSLQPEIHFIQKGLKIVDQEYDETITILFNSLDFALMSKFNFLNLGESTKAYVAATPYVGYSLSGTFKEEYDGMSYTEDIDFDDDEIRRFDFGIGLGIGLSWNRFFVDARYNFGLLNIDNYEDEDEYYDEYDFRVYHRGILIGVGYRF